MFAGRTCRIWKGTNPRYASPWKVSSVRSGGRKPWRSSGAQVEWRKRRSFHSWNMAGDWWGLFLASLSLSQSIESVSTFYSLDDLKVWVFVVHHREFAVVL